MTERLVRKVVLAALKGERGDGGWLKIDAPRASDKEISLAVMEAAERGLVEACNVSDFDSPYPEWKLMGPTGMSAKFIRDTRVSKKVWAVVGAIAASVVAFLAWLIPVLINLRKK